MDYFIMSQDKRLLNAVQLNLPNSQHSRSLARGPIEDSSRTAIIYVKKGSRTEYPDYIETPILLISQKFKRIMSKYQNNILFQAVVLIERESGHQHVHYSMTVPELACASEETIYDRSGNVVEFVLDEAKVGQARIFCASDYNKKLVVRLDVAESILRREPNGIWFDQLKIAERG